MVARSFGPSLDLWPHSTSVVAPRLRRLRPSFYPKRQPFADLAQERLACQAVRPEASQLQGEETGHLSRIPSRVALVASLDQRRPTVECGDHRTCQGEIRVFDNRPPRLFASVDWRWLPRDFYQTTIKSGLAAQSVCHKSTFQAAPCEFSFPLNSRQVCHETTVGISCFGFLFRCAYRLSRQKSTTVTLRMIFPFPRIRFAS